MLRFRDKSVVITGGSSGIGLAAAGLLWTILQIVGIALNQAG